MNTQIMLDLETLGTKPGSVIVAIGAVKFDKKGLLDIFYERVDAESCVAAGLKLDAATVLWWMKQNETARLEITRPGNHVTEVLEEFSRWVGLDGADVWGNGASFDNVLLATAYDAIGRKTPWMAHKNSFCYRTLKAMHPNIPFEPVYCSRGPEHHALADAEAQAIHLIKILDSLK